MEAFEKHAGTAEPIRVLGQRPRLQETMTGVPTTRAALCAPTVLLRRPGFLIPFVLYEFD